MPVTRSMTTKPSAAGGSSINNAGRGKRVPPATTTRTKLTKQPNNAAPLSKVQVSSTKAVTSKTETKSKVEVDVTSKTEASTSNFETCTSKAGTSTTRINTFSSKTEATKTSELNLKVNESWAKTTKTATIVPKQKKKQLVMDTLSEETSLSLPEVVDKHELSVQGTTSSAPSLISPKVVGVIKTKAKEKERMCNEKVSKKKVGKKNCKEKSRVKLDIIPFKHSTHSRKEEKSSETLGAEIDKERLAQNLCRFQQVFGSQSRWKTRLDDITNAHLQTIAISQAELNEDCSKVMTDFKESRNNPQKFFNKTPLMKELKTNFSKQPPRAKKVEALRAAARAEVRLPHTKRFRSPDTETDSPVVLKRQVRIPQKFNFVQATIKQPKKKLKNGTDEAVDYPSSMQPPIIIELGDGEVEVAIESCDKPTVTINEPTAFADVTFVVPNVPKQKAATVTHMEFLDPHLSELPISSFTHVTPNESARNPPMEDKIVEYLISQMNTTFSVPISTVQSEDETESREQTPPPHVLKFPIVIPLSPESDYDKPQIDEVIAEDPTEDIPSQVNLDEAFHQDERDPVLLVEKSPPEIETYEEDSFEDLPAKFQCQNKIDNYDITLLADYDEEELNHRTNKPIPDWATNAKKLNLLLYSWGATFMEDGINDRILPPSKSYCKFFPHAKPPPGRQPD